MARPRKNAVMSKETPSTLENRMWAKARAEYEQEIKPQREREQFESYRRDVRSNDSAKISAVIFQALTNADIRADVALREYIAELIDDGRDADMNTQLRFYLVQYLVHPLQRPLQSWVRGT